MAAVFCGTHGSVAMASACSIAPLDLRREKLALLTDDERPAYYH
jgi:hypothetical protein